MEPIVQDLLNNFNQYDTWNEIPIIHDEYIMSLSLCREFDLIKRFRDLGDDYIEELHKEISITRGIEDLSSYVILLRSVIKRQIISKDLGDGMFNHYNSAEASLQNEICDKLSIYLFKLLCHHNLILSPNKVKVTGVLFKQ